MRPQKTISSLPTWCMCRFYICRGIVADCSLPAAPLSLQCYKARSDCGFLWIPSSAILLQCVTDIRNTFNWVRHLDELTELSEYRMSRDSSEENACGVKAQLFLESIHQTFFPTMAQRDRWQFLLIGWLIHPKNSCCCLSSSIFFIILVGGGGGVSSSGSDEAACAAVDLRFRSTTWNDWLKCRSNSCKSTPRGKKLRFQEFVNSDFPMQQRTWLRIEHTVHETWSKVKGWPHRATRQ